MKAPSGPYRRLLAGKITPERYNAIVKRLVDWEFARAATTTRDRSGRDQELASKNASLVRRVQEAELALREMRRAIEHYLGAHDKFGAWNTDGLRAVLGGDGQQEGLGYWVHVCRHGVDLDRETCFRGCQEPRK